MMPSNDPIADRIPDPYARAHGLAEEFAASIDRLIVRLEEAGDAAADRAPAPDAWSATRIGYHVAIATDAFAAIMRGDGASGVGPGAAPAPPGFRETPWADVVRAMPARRDATEDLLPPSDVTRGEAIARLSASRDAFVTMLRTLPPERGAGYCLTHPFVGTIAVYQIAEWATAHIKLHNAQAKRALAAAEAGGAA